MRRFRVSSFLADVTQQIHSFRASGVMSVQRLFTASWDSIAFRKSAGSAWIVPPASVRVVMHLFPCGGCHPAPMAVEVSRSIDLQTTHASVRLDRTGPVPKNPRTR